MLVVGLDPGVTTGWCLYNEDVGEVVASGVIHVQLDGGGLGVAESWMEAEMEAADAL